MPLPVAAEIATLRAFNRAYTLRLGLLNPHLDGSPFTLAEARVLYELFHRAKTVAADLSRVLDLDRAQLSRTLKRFAERGLVQTSDPVDGGRRRPIELTEAGHSAFLALDQSTHKAIGTLLKSLPTAKRSRLVLAAKSITRVFEEGSDSGVMLRAPRAGDLGWIIHRQAILYAEEFGWNAEYEALVARILSDFVKGHDPTGEAAWVAEVDGSVAGSVFLVRGDAAGTGKLRLLYVEPEVRGRGVGAALVAACIERARAIGYERLMLWTNSVLVSARRLYERAGFTLVEETPYHSFGVDLLGQTWSLDLQSAETA